MAFLCPPRATPPRQREQRTGRDPSEGTPSRGRARDKGTDKDKDKRKRTRRRGRRGQGQGRGDGGGEGDEEEEEPRPSQLRPLPAPLSSASNGILPNPPFMHLVHLPSSPLPPPLPPPLPLPSFPSQSPRFALDSRTSSARTCIVALSRHFALAFPSESEMIRAAQRAAAAVRSRAIAAPEDAIAKWKIVRGDTVRAPPPARPLSLFLSASPRSSAFIHAFIRAGTRVRFGMRTSDGDARSIGRGGERGDARARAKEAPAMERIGERGHQDGAPERGRLR